MSANGQKATWNAPAPALFSNSVDVDFVISLDETGVTDAWAWRPATILRKVSHDVINLNVDSTAFCVPFGDSLKFIKTHILCFANIERGCKCDLYSFFIACKIYF